MSNALTLPDSARHIARKDRLILLRDARLRLALLLVVLLSLTAVAATYNRFAEISRHAAAATAAERANWLGQGESNPHFAAHFGQWVFRPTEGMALLDPGVTPHAGAAIFLEAHTRNPADFRAAEERVGTLDAGEFSAAWVLQTLGPLLAFVLAAGLVAHERESGTLRLLMASGAAPVRVVAGKARALLANMLYATLPVLIAAAAALALLPSDNVADMLTRAVLWVVTHALWLGMAVLLGIAVSACAATTCRALVLLMALWVLAVLLTPRAAASLAQVLHPTPTGAQFMAAIEKDIKDGVGDIPDEMQRYEQMRERLLREHQVERVEDLPVNFIGTYLEASEAIGAQIHALHWARLRDIYAAQRRTMRVAALVSPLLAVQNLSAALAGTDNQHLQAFENQAEAQRINLVQTLHHDFAVHGAGVGMYKGGLELWQQVEAFHYQSVPATQALRHVWPDALILLGWLAAAFALLRAASQRLDQEMVQ